MTKVLPDYEKGLLHIGDTGSDENIARTHQAYLRAIAKNGDLDNPYGGYYIKLRARSMYALYQDKDLKSSKRIAYAAGVARRAALQSRLYYQTVSYLSDNRQLIHWFGQFVFSALQGTYKRKMAYKIPCQVEHYTFQMSHALLGNWDILAENCEAALRETPKDRKYYQFDYAFLLGLARGSMTEMEDALVKLLNGRVLRARASESGFGDVSNLIYGWGFILCKIAWLHGYEINPGNPWIPEELLPLKPLEAEDYSVGIEEIDQFDIFMPFEDDASKWCKNASLFSPKPLGEQLDIESLIPQIEWGELPCGSKELIKINT